MNSLAGGVRLEAEPSKRYLKQKGQKKEEALECKGACC